MSASAGRKTAAEQVGCFPGTVFLHAAFTRKVVGAHEKHIVINHLGAGRFVIGVVQAHKCVSKERNQFSTRRPKPVSRRPRLYDFGQVCLHLALEMLVLVKAHGPLGSFTSGEQWLGELELMKLSR